METSEQVQKIVSNTYTNEERALQASANAKILLAKAEMVPYEDYESAFSVENNDTKNPGKRSAGDELAIVESLRNGMSTAPVISADSYLGLRGYLRAAALRIIKINYPDDFAKHYANGVSCVLVDGLTEEEEMFLACDHGTQKARSREAIIDQGMAMLRRGCSPYNVVIELSNEMDVAFGPVKATALAKIAKATTVDDQLQALFMARRFHIQSWQRLNKLPPCVYEAYLNKLNGIDGPQLGASDLATLEKTNAGGTKHAPTPEFLVEFEQRIKKTDNGEGSPGPMTKPNQDNFIVGVESNTIKTLFFLFLHRAEFDAVALDHRLAELEESGMIPAELTMVGVKYMEAFLQAKAKKQKAIDDKKKEKAQEAATKAAEKAQAAQEKADAAAKEANAA